MRTDTIHSVGKTYSTFLFYCYFFFKLSNYLICNHDTCTNAYKKYFLLFVPLFQIFNLLNEVGELVYILGEGGDCCGFKL